MSPENKFEARHVSDYYIPTVCLVVTVTIVTLARFAFQITVYTLTFVPLSTYVALFTAVGAFSMSIHEILYRKRISGRIFGFTIAMTLLNAVTHAALYPWAL